MVPLLLFLSGAAALSCEVVWTRRLGLELGSTGVAVALALGVYMGGLGLGAALGARRSWRRPLRAYGLLELGAATWALTFPLALDLLRPLVGLGPSLGGLHPLGAGLCSMLLLGPPAVLLGATLPAVSGVLAHRRDAAGLYAVNTAGAVLGVLLCTFVALPALGLRATELTAAGLAATVGLVAVLRGGAATAPAPAPRSTSAPLGLPALLAGVAGFGAMALEVVWTRVAAMLVGGSVHAFALVLAAFLAGIALGAAWGRRAPVKLLPTALSALGLLALVGSALTRVLPHTMVALFAAGGSGSLWLPVQGVLLVVGMAGAPVASGAVFALAVRATPGEPSQAAGRVLSANTVGGVLGAVGAGLLFIPLLGIRGTLLLVAASAVAAATLARPRLPFHVEPEAPAGGLGWGLLHRLHAAPRWAGALALVLLALLPGFHPRLYVSGLFMQLDAFVDPSPAAVERYGASGWELLSYEDGPSASVAVGRGTKSGTTWLSVNGKVDASDGEDMPTQVLSGRLPLQVALGRDPTACPRVAVVGLASGVTAAEALDSGACTLDIIELEPAVVRASEHFVHVNKRVLADPRTSLHIADARAWLARSGRPFDVLISEPSNPWLTGVSNLFTQEYWQLTRAHLADDGVMVQWVQLYALPPEGLRSLIATFLSVYPRAWLFESIPTADALLVAAPSLPAGLEPLLGPEELAALAEGARLNTDDHPWIEFEAPRWLHRSTGADNQELLEATARPASLSPR